MEVATRQELRNRLLNELYEHHFDKGGREVQFDIKENDEENKEQLLALEYLAGKGLIDFKRFHKGAYIGKITSYGIDFVEQSK
jgi:hypothetical protein